MTTGRINQVAIVVGAKIAAARHSSALCAVLCACRCSDACLPAACAPLGLAGRAARARAAVVVSVAVSNPRGRRTPCCLDSVVSSVSGQVQSRRRIPRTGAQPAIYSKLLRVRGGLRETEREAHSVLEPVPWHHATGHGLLSLRRTLGTCAAGPGTHHQSTPEDRGRAYY